MSLDVQFYLGVMLGVFLAVFIEWWATFARIEWERWNLRRLEKTQMIQDLKLLADLERKKKRRRS